MNEKNLADMAVKITQVIKQGISLDSQQLMVVMLQKIPELGKDVNKTISLFTDLAEQLGFRFADVYDILDQLKLRIRTAISEVSRSSWLHTIATALYIVASIAVNLLPPAWKEASKAVISGYEALYGNS